MTTGQVQTLQAQIDGYRKEQRIATVLAKLVIASYQADSSLSKELKSLLAFSSAAKASSKHIKGPEDLGTVQSSVNEIQGYRDRALAILLDAIEIRAEIDRGWYIIQQVLLLKPEVVSKTVAVQGAIISQTAEELESMSSAWEVIINQAEAIVRNCRDAYNAIYLQAETAKQMWYMGQRLDATAEPLGKQLNRG